MGAWIEITYAQTSMLYGLVAPLVGAWIEIIYSSTLFPMSGSLLSWERGLKFDSPGNIRYYIVAPLVGAWIEIAIPFTRNSMSSSLLSWERGLKYECNKLVPVHIRRSSRGSVD